jgi:hypothetical protein
LSRIVRHFQSSRLIFVVPEIGIDQERCWYLEP